MNSIQVYCNSKKDVAEYVEDLIRTLSNDYQWTMTITQDISGDYSVVTVTDASSDDIELLAGRFYYKRQSSILKVLTPAG